MDEIKRVFRGKRDLYTPNAGQQQAGRMLTLVWGIREAFLER